MHTAKGMGKIKERVRNKPASPGPQSSISLGAPGSFSVQGKAAVEFALASHLPVILQEPMSWFSALYNQLHIKPEM